MGERRWGLWELCEDKEQRGSPVVLSDHSRMHLSLSCYPRLSLPCSRFNPQLFWEGAWGGEEGGEMAGQGLRR